MRSRSDKFMQSKARPSRPKSRCRRRDRLTGGSAAVDAYVDPLSGSNLKQAIYNQTRIEFWGEGKSYLALKRNQATVTRGTNHVFRPNQSFAYDIDEMSFQIPQVEMDNNPSITGQN